MRSKSEHFASYREKIEACISTGEFSWSTLTNEIRATAFVPKNWMVVRTVLAQYLQEGHIIRTPDLSKEIYVSTNRGLGKL